MRASFWYNAPHCINWGMKVSAILKGRIDKDGRQTIYIRTSVGGKRKYISTKIKIEPKRFVGEEIVDHPDAKRFNQILKKHMVQAEHSILFETNKTFKKKTGLFEYINDCMREWDTTKMKTTLYKHWSEVNKLKDFTGKIMIDDVTAQWLNKYKMYLFRRGNQENTVWGTMKFLRTIFRKAHREGVIEINPFEYFSMPKYRDPNKIYLTKTEIDKIEEYLNDSPTDEELFAGTWFLVACYTGLRYGDLVAFRKDQHIREGRIILYTNKTKELVSMPLSDRLRTYFERIEYKAMYYTNTHYNRLLKSIGEQLKINGNLSSHIARHTFATLAATVGISQEVTAKLLGHKSLKTTAIYYRIVDSRVDSELQKMV